MAIAASGLSGCAFQEHRASLHALARDGLYDAAAELLDEPSTQKLYGSADRVLFLMDRGAVAFSLGEHALAFSNLEQAERLTEETSGGSFGDDAARWLVNDASAAYIPGAYEDMYLNVLKLVSHLETGRIGGVATVEARRLASKANRLRDQYLTYRDAAEREARSRLGESAARDAADPSSSLVASVGAGDFIESPLGTFLTAVTFLKAGESQNHQVASRRLLEAVRLQGDAGSGVIGAVRADDFLGLESLPPSKADVLLVAFSGTCPEKRPLRVGPIVIASVPVYFEIPVLDRPPLEAAAARALIRRVETDGSLTLLHTQPLALVEDMAAVAAENHRRQLPIIYLRTLIRAAAKSAASYTATRAVDRSTDDNDLAQIGAVLAGLAFLAVTEKADVRTWAFLPGRAHVAVVDVPAGEYEITIDYFRSDGDSTPLYSSPPRRATVTDRSSDLATVVARYWR